MSEPDRAGSPRPRSGPRSGSRDARRPLALRAQVDLELLDAPPTSPWDAELALLSARPRARRLPGVTIVAAVRTDGLAPPSVRPASLALATELVDRFSKSPVAVFALGAGVVGEWHIDRPDIDFRWVRRVVAGRADGRGDAAVARVLGCRGIDLFLAVRLAAARDGEVVRAPYHAKLYDDTGTRLLVLREELVWPVAPAARPSRPRLRVVHP